MRQRGGGRRKNEKEAGRRYGGTAGKDLEGVVGREWGNGVGESGGGRKGCGICTGLKGEKCSRFTSSRKNCQSTPYFFSPQSHSHTQPHTQIILYIFKYAIIVHCNLHDISIYRDMK